MSALEISVAIFACSLLIWMVTVETRLLLLDLRTKGKE